MYIAAHSTRDGYIYCVREDEVLAAATLECMTCPYFKGTLQGDGRECEVSDDGQVVVIDDPWEYMESKQDRSKEDGS